MTYASKKFKYGFLALSLFATIHGNEQQTSIFKVVKDLHVPSLDLPSEVSKPVTLSEKDKKKLTLQVNVLTSEQVIPMIYDLCTEHIQVGNDSKTETDSTFLSKMELFAGGEHKKDSLLNKIDHTKTSFGKVLLALQLAQPIYDVTILTLRQELIKTLINDQELLQKIEQQLAIMAVAEPYLFSYFEQENTVNEELFKKVYFGEWFNYLNTSAIALEGWTRLGNLGNFFMATLLPLEMLNIGTEINYLLAGMSENPITRTQALGKTIKNIPYYVSALDPRLRAFKDKPYFNGSTIDYQTLGDVLHVQDYRASLSPENANVVRGERISAGIGISMILGAQAYFTYSAFKDATLKRDISNYLQTKMIAVASYFQAAKELYELAQTNPILSTIPGLQHIEELFNPYGKISSDLKHLINLLDHNTFTGKASVFSLTGRVLAAHQLMKKVKNELIPACAAASTFDVYFSTAKLYNKFENQRVHFTFANYITNAQAPYVNLKAFWNPGVDASIVVANDIIFGLENPNNIILTGPNTGGKSTVIKSSLIGLLLAQTIGIAPCDELTFTPFVVLNCYLNITDDLSAGVSLFKAEVLRAKALIEAIRRLQVGQFSFTIMDEVFSGTSPKEGEEAAYMFAKELGIMQNSICTIATHFPKLTDLEDMSRFKNYQVKVWKDENNNWVRPFKLEEGKSTLNIAMDLLEEAGIFSHA